MSWESDYDRWKTTPPEPPDSEFKCESCENDLYEGDVYYDIEGSCICDKCAQEWLEAMKKIVTYEQEHGI